MSRNIRVIGAGLAGCEAAWQAANLGAHVTLYEMRPSVSTGAHRTSDFAELVCSNSLRSISLENAVGLLKEELARLGSLIVSAARETAVPAGGALAVDRERFSESVESRLQSHPSITIKREEVRSLDGKEPTIVACGPLASPALADELARLCGKPQLHYYDAASPIVSADSIDMSQVFAGSRYGKGGDDYLNIPLDREQYLELVTDLVNSPKAAPHGALETLDEASIEYFEACLPVEEMARRGVDTLRFGPLKPVGLQRRDVGGDCQIAPYAVVQLRRENAAGTAYNMVGFQTRLTWPAQKATFGKLPGLHDAEWLRLGVMHRNTFVDAPRVLAEDLSLRNAAHVFLAGQVSGCEGYVEAAATGLLAAHNAWRRISENHIPFRPSTATALGALLAYLQDTTSPDFQPQNVTFAYFSPLASSVRDKRERRRLMAQRSLSEVDRIAAELAAQRAAVDLQIRPLEKSYA
ncbi:MAG TPA: methylenetetrahydrofolate--tRNA-(uracil(54)-C(5))-methyltransferase (FADH(2)-oxidizing) TrmFO [Candidatus Acidoferrales bacterium]|nr:methylenetetrahydrofolate--tRNA-(uracil(54)-C(5))-methyltransferase (FADH(2)-oxidizing) TrmFO [Candidatus Acidoferrales bacterium]